MEQFGIEALSRGAKRAYFCDNNVDAIKILTDNLNKTKLISNAIIIKKDYKLALNEIKEKIDIVFLDPPYKLNLAANSIKLLLRFELIYEDTLIIIETDEVDRDIAELENIPEIQIIDKRKYGRANLLFIKKRGT